MPHTFWNISPEACFPVSLVNLAWRFAPTWQSNFYGPAACLKALTDGASRGAGAPRQAGWATVATNTVGGLLVAANGLVLVDPGLPEIVRRRGQWSGSGGSPHFLTQSRCTWILLDTGDDARSAQEDTGGFEEHTTTRNEERRLGQGNGVAVAHKLPLRFAHTGE